MENLSPSQLCAKFNVQNCHACERVDCGDNQTPGILELRRRANTAEEALRKAKACVSSRTWLLDGRGPYRYDDPKFYDEIKELLYELRSVLQSY
jgi:hypothetical protein